MAGVVPEFPKFQFKSALGIPLVNGTLTVYEAGTTTLTNTWQDVALTVLNQNPITLDSRGECLLYLDPAQSYKFVLKNAAGSTQWTQDSITGPNLASREIVSVIDFGADRTGIAASGQAFVDAINYAIANYPCTVDIPAGYYICDQAWPVITRPISIRGWGIRQSIVSFPASVSGQLITLRAVGFGNETTDMIKDGTVPFTSIANAQAGFSMADICLQGNRSGTQDGVVFEGNCDNATLQDVMLDYFNGYGFRAGKTYNSIRGSLRESSFRNLKIRNCGKTDGTASFRIESPASPGNTSEDSSNLCLFDGLEIIFPYGKGLEIVDTRTVDAGSPIYGMRFRNVTLHERSSSPYTNGALLRLEGYVVDIEMDVNFAFQHENQSVGVFAPNASLSSLQPRAIRINALMPNIVKGLEFQDARSVALRLDDVSCRREVVSFGASFNGPLQIEYASDNCYVSTTTAITLSGTSAIAFTPDSSMTSFMPAFATNGTGDTKPAVVAGITGVVTRSGSIGAGTATYTFTPDSTSTATIPANSYFSAVVIPSTLATKVGGWSRRAPYFRSGVEAATYRVPFGGSIEYDANGVGRLAKTSMQVDGNLVYSGVDSSGALVPMFNYQNNGTGLFTQFTAPVVMGSAWNSGSLLRLGSYRLWVDSTGRLRIKSSDPTGDTDGAIVGTQS